MAFNLNKTDEPVSKFNLSKGEEAPAGEENKKGSRKAVWILLAIVAIGSLAWYLLRDQPAAENVTTATLPAASQELPVTRDSGAATVTGADAPANTIQAGGSTTETSINALQNSVPASFGPGSSSLLEATAVVNQLVNVLSKNPGKKIVIKGYASSEGDEAVNRQLSGERARSFKDLLVSKGIAADRIATEARGTEDPAASNETEEGRRKNRRVQVTITD